MATKILIVDDSKLARMSVSKLLSELRPSWVRLEAANADEAIKQTFQEHPDIILLDFNMPGQSGLELAARLYETHPDIPVAIVSANIQVEIVERAAMAGATFIAKPLTQPALAEFLSAAEARIDKR
jgi:CheY-like chemotaxis protein